MKSYLNVIILLMISLGLITCDEEADNVIGSRDHDIKSSSASTSELLADGVSAATIKAVVTDKNGEPAFGMKVIFQTTHGSIERFAFSNYYGEVSADLTSAASYTDITVEVTATVVDTTFDGLNKGNPDSYSIRIISPEDASEHASMQKEADAQDNTAKIKVKFIGVSFTPSIEDTVLPADGLSETKIRVKIFETTSQNPIQYAKIKVGTRYGTIVNSTTSNENGFCEIYLRSAIHAAVDSLSVTFGVGLTKYMRVEYVNPKFDVTTNKAKVPADGESIIEVTGTLLTTRNNPIIGAEVEFYASNGLIQQKAITDQYGRATVNLIATTEPDSTVEVVGRFLSLSDTTYVGFVATIINDPNSILLTADPSFIWVKETGREEQTTITAEVLNVKGRPVGNDLRLRLSIVSSPGGGIYISPSEEGSTMETPIMPTIDGRVQATIRSGIRSGTVRIRAELVDYPNVAAKTTNFVIRSGPAYMWINPNNKNDVIQHGTLVCEPTKHNVCFANPVQDIKMTAIFGDKYNNPVEEGTAVYFTSTGGVITTDALTNEKGQTAVVLQNVNPFPYLDTDDPYQLTTCCIPNPNDESLMLNLLIPDFEGGKVLNTLGNLYPNDGIAMVLAYTWGEDQNGNTVKVWTTKPQVFSAGVLVFDVTTDRTELKLDEAANIEIELYDIHGNPMAAGSKLLASTTLGKLSETSLMASPENYGYGRTHFSTDLINDLDPTEDDEGTAVVTIELDSPNGSMKRSVSVFLSLDP
ncbi:hypothetical protein GF337_09175 [candidate division KSB1 bacterium]|nr:hypothetical protein [candidate division KSB1 bacterium]